MSADRRMQHHGAVLVMVALVVAAVGLVGMPVRADGVTKVVAPWGDDAAEGTAEAPFRTVTRGLLAVGPGDTLLLREGTYVEDVRSPRIQRGTPEARIRFANWPGERPVIQGLLWMKGASYWTLDGLAVTWNPGRLSTEHMVKMTNGVGWRVTRSEFWGAQSFAGLLVASTVAGEPADWAVEENCIHDTQPSNDVNQDHLIYTNTGLTAGAGRIARNVLFNAPNGTGVKLGGPSPLSGGATRVTVTENTIWNTAQNLLVAWQSNDNVISRNLLGSTGPGYGTIRGYQLAGAGNVASGNVAGGATSVFLNDTGYVGVADGGGNVFPVEPAFDDTTTCAGFHPADPVAASVGRYAPPLPPVEDLPPTTTTSVVDETTTTTALDESTTTTTEHDPTATTTTEPPPTTTEPPTTTSTTTTTTEPAPSTTTTTTTVPTTTTAPPTTTTVKPAKTTTTTTTKPTTTTVKSSTTTTTAKPRTRR